MIFTYRTDSSNFLAMPLRLYDFSTHIRLIPHFAGSGSVLQHHGCELSLGLTGDVDWLRAIILYACYEMKSSCVSTIGLGGKLHISIAWHLSLNENNVDFKLTDDIFSAIQKPTILLSSEMYMYIYKYHGKKTVDGWSKSKSVICKAWFTKRIHKTMCSSNNEVPSVTNKLQESVVKNFAH